MSQLDEPPRRRGRAPLPPGRTFFSDLGPLLGISERTCWRRYRPHDDAVELVAWARRLDIRRRDGDRALHCDTIAALALRDELLTRGLALHDLRPGEAADDRLAFGSVPADQSPVARIPAMQARLDAQAADAPRPGGPRRSTNVTRGGPSSESDRS